MLLQSYRTLAPLEPDRSVFSNSMFLFAKCSVTTRYGDAEENLIPPSLKSDTHYVVIPQVVRSDEEILATLDPRIWGADYDPVKEYLEKVPDEIPHNFLENDVDRILMRAHTPTHESQISNHPNTPK